jgi:hypothetical protein
LNQESVGSIPTPGTKQQIAGSSNGRTGRSERLDVGSIPTPAARAHGPTGRHKLRTLEIWVRFPVRPLNSPVVQRQRLLSYKQETMVQLHPGLLTNAQVRQLAERLGLNPSVCRFDSCSGHIRLGRQLADHLGLEPGMLWVRIPPELLAIELRPRGAAWSARLPVTQEITGSNPVEGACGTVRQLAERRNSNLRVCGFDSRLCH